MQVIEYRIRLTLQDERSDQAAGRIAKRLKTFVNNLQVAGIVESFEVRLTSARFEGEERRRSEKEGL